MQLIEVDGSYGEGGGQIIRTAVALSAVSGKPCRISNIRAGRPNPGLQAQHLNAIEAVAQLCGAETKGLKPRSQDVEFYPKEIQSGKIEIDVGTAGSCYLILHSLIPAALHAKSVDIVIKGGTDVKWAPTSSSTKQVFLRFLKDRGIDVDLQIRKYGFYPKGGGIVEAFIRRSEPSGFVLEERGKFVGYNIESVTSKDLKVAGVSERAAENAKKILGNVKSENIQYVDTLSSGSSFHANAEFENVVFGEDLLGERGLKSEDLGKKCAEALKKNLARGGCVDRHLADQIMIYAALSAGKDPSSFTASEITDHCRTNAWVIEKFLPVKFRIDEKKRRVVCKKI